MHLTPSRWTFPAALLCCLAGSACNPGRDQPEDVPGGDMSTGEPCARGSTRCSTDQGSVQVCNGQRWTLQKSCNVGAGQTCRGGGCVGPCDLLPSGSTGCSFFPVNLWSTSISGQLGIVASNTSSTLSAEVKLADLNGVIDTQT